MPTKFQIQVPNAITAVRVAAAFAFPFLSESWHLAVIAIALVSEFLDGFVARLFNLESYFGQVFDPVADKLFFFSVALTWTLMGKLSLAEWALLGVRDIGVVLIAMGLALIGRIGKVKSIKAKLLSKVVTTLQYLVMLCILFDIDKPVPKLIAITAMAGGAAVVQYVYLLQIEHRQKGT